MYFFETIEGLKGENLTSAVLKYLLTNSSCVRSMFAEVISSMVPPSEVPTFRNGISCETEVKTEVEGGSKGFIDLLIRSDNELIGIENKLWAEIQNDQPRKYVPHLLELAKNENRSENILLVVLAPQERKKEVEAEVKRQDIKQRVIFIYWQDVLRKLRTLHEDSASNQVVTIFFVEYLQAYLGPLRIPKEKVVGQVGIGNKYQIDLLGKLQHLVNDLDGFSARRLAPGKTFYGFGFDYETESRKLQCWFEFIQQGDVCIFVVQNYRADPTLNIPGLTPLPDAWAYGPVLKFDFPKWPETMVEWREFLDPTFEAIIENAKQQPEVESAEAKP